MVRMLKDKLLIVLVLLVFSSLFLIPIKNFSSGDDYAYYNTTENFLDGEFKLHANISMTFVLQGLYGALVSIIIGFSHSSLIIATIILSGITVISVYIFLRKLVGKKLAFLGSLVLLFGIRQYGIAPILGLALYYMVNRRGELLKPRNIILLIVIPILIFAIWYYWYFGLNIPSDCITSYFTLGGNILRTIGKGGLFIGYFFFPLGILYLVNYKTVVSEFKRLKNIFKLAVTSLVLIMIGWLFFINIFQNDSVFYSTSLSSNLGLGATVNVISGEKNNIFPEIFWIPITFLSIVGMTSISIHAFSLINDRKYNFIFYILLAEILALIFIKAFYERYLMVFFCPAAWIKI